MTYKSYGLVLRPWDLDLVSFCEALGLRIHDEEWMEVTGAALKWSFGRLSGSSYRWAEISGGLAAHGFLNKLQVSSRSPIDS